jgi:23S rRNA (guanine745-N1)-methyltransferase
MGLAGALAHLRCPHCAAGLALDGGSVRCDSGHAFDVARQGYVSLAPAGGPPLRGDTAAMVAARAAFLRAGHFDAIAEAVAEEASAAGGGVAGCVADVGAGTGHHLGRALERLPGRPGLALDSSRFALRRAARAHPRIGAVACDAWRALPVRDATAAVVLSVFAPRDAAEIARVLAPGGALVLVTPTERHLAELVAALGLLHVDERKAQRVQETVGARLEPVRERTCERTLELGAADARAVAQMGPSAHHLDPRALEERLAALADPVWVGVSVRVSVFRRG